MKVELCKRNVVASGAIAVLVNKDDDFSDWLSSVCPTANAIIRDMDETVTSLSLNEGIFFRSRGPERENHHIVKMFDRTDGNSLRESGARVLKALEENKVTSCTVLIRDKDDAANIIEGMMLASYKFDKYKSFSKAPKISISCQKLTASTLDRSLLISDAVNFARRLGDTPACDLTPKKLASEIQSHFKRTNVKVDSWGRGRCLEEKFLGLDAVSKGSDEEPQFITLRYDGAGTSDRPICLIGKAITFDSGGLCIKSRKNMSDMKYDMCGGAAVAGTVFAIAQLGLKVNVLGLIPACENLTGGSAFKQGDIITARSGKTIEVTDTDAEGRLVLMDALCYASEQAPKCIIDIATLTGAIGVALGKYHTGLFSDSDKLAKAITSASSRSGEPIWRMPVTPHHAKDMKSDIADLVNHSESPEAGSSKAAAFLREFVDDSILWAHLDIASTAWAMSDNAPYYPKKKASGIMVRTLVELAMYHQELD